MTTPNPDLTPDRLKHSYGRWDPARILFLWYTSKRLKLKLHY